MATSNPCPKCDDDGYLPDSTLTFPHYCSCPAGERARAGVPFAGRDGWAAQQADIVNETGA